MDVGDSVQVRPLAGDMAEERFSVPVNPFWLVNVIVELPLAPVFTVTADGLAVILKLTTLIVRATV